MRKAFRFREQEQSRCFRAISAQDYGLRPLKNLPAIRVEVYRACNSTMRVGLDGVYVRIRPDFAAAGFFG
jgi:hypothetical protein